MTSLQTAIAFALAAIMAPYLITKPGHVHALLAIVCFGLFCQSVINFGDAFETDVSSSTLAVFISILFLATVANSPLSWLSLILYEDPSQVPVSQRPTPISQWLRPRRQLTPADTNLSQGVKDLVEDLNEAYSLIKKYIPIQAALELCRSDNDELKAETEALKKENAEIKAQRDEAERETAREKVRAKAWVDRVEKITLRTMEQRDRLIAKVPYWCEHKTADLNKDLADAKKEHDDHPVPAPEPQTTKADNHLVTKAEMDEALALKDILLAGKDRNIAAAEEVIADRERIIAEQDEVIAEKDKIISAKGEEALAHTASADLGDSAQASLFAHIGVLAEQLDERNSEVARLNGYIDSHACYCCGHCGGGPSSGGSDDDDDGGDDGTNDDDDGTNSGGPPQGGDAQPPTPANEPSGAPPCPPAEPSSNPPPAAGEPSDDDDAAAGGPIPPAPITPVSSPLSSPPASPVVVPAPSASVSTPPAAIPTFTASAPSSPVVSSSTFVPDPASPATGTSDPPLPARGT